MNGLNALGWVYAIMVAVFFVALVVVAVSCAGLMVSS